MKFLLVILIKPASDSGAVCGTHAELDALFHMEINILELKVILDAYNYPYPWSAIEFHPQNFKISTISCPNKASVFYLLLHHSQSRPRGRSLARPNMPIPLRSRNWMRVQKVQLANNHASSPPLPQMKWEDEPSGGRRRQKGESRGRGDAGSRAIIWKFALLQHGNNKESK